MVNNFQKIIEEREHLLPPELEDRITLHLGTFSVLGKVLELYVPHILQTMVRMAGGDELPCIRARKHSDDPPWRKAPEPGQPKRVD
ncbi:MAG: hypothetical protein KGS48_04325 [Bacteroidetes bacterium]|nr:hypothetical protein [Bacteroidota bacterium]